MLAAAVVVFQGRLRFLAPPPAGAAEPALAEAAVVNAPPLNDAGYWDFVLAPAGSRPAVGRLRRLANDTRINACALMTHSIAALLDHNGPSRRDDRARRLAARLCETLFRPARGRPTTHSDPRSETQRCTHLAGSRNQAQDSDAPLRGSKSCACSLLRWRARRAARAAVGTVRRMVTQVRSVATSPFFRYPNIRLNQINFSAELQRARQA